MRTEDAPHRAFGGFHETGQRVDRQYNTDDQIGEVAVVADVLQVCVNKLLQGVRQKSEEKRVLNVKVVNCQG